MRITQQKNTPVTSGNIKVPEGKRFGFIRTQEGDAFIPPPQLGQLRYRMSNGETRLFAITERTPKGLQVKAWMPQEGETSKFFTKSEAEKARNVMIGGSFEDLALAFMYSGVPGQQKGESVYKAMERQPEFHWLAAAWSDRGNIEMGRSVYRPESQEAFNALPTEQERIKGRERYYAMKEDKWRSLPAMTDAEWLNFLRNLETEHYDWLQEIQWEYEDQIDSWLHCKLRERNRNPYEQPQWVIEALSGQYGQFWGGQFEAWLHNIALNPGLKRLQEINAAQFEKDREEGETFGGI